MSRAVPALRAGTACTGASQHACPLQSLHAAVAASSNAYFLPTLAIACSPVDAGQT